MNKTTKTLFTTLSEGPHALLRYSLRSKLFNAIACRFSISQFTQLCNEIWKVRHLVLYYCNWVIFNDACTTPTTLERTPLPDLMNTRSNYLYCCTVHLVDSLVITQPTNALIVCHLF